MFNGCDYLRTLMVPLHTGCWRDFQGVHTDPTSKRSCVAHQHADGCSGAAGGCLATSMVWLPQGRPLVLPSYVLFKKNRTSQRFTPWARMDVRSVPPTVLGYTGAHALALLHPSQPRIVTVAENKRLQGHPDYYALTTRPPKRWAARVWPGIAADDENDNCGGGGGGGNDAARPAGPDEVDEGAGGGGNGGGKKKQRKPPRPSGQLVPLLSHYAAVPHEALLVDYAARAADFRRHPGLTLGSGSRGEEGGGSESHLLSGGYPTLRHGLEPYEVRIAQPVCNPGSALCLAW